MKRAKIGIVKKTEKKELILKGDLRGGKDRDEVEKLH